MSLKPLLTDEVGKDIAKAIRENIVSNANLNRLQSEIDVLNNGGLILKEDYIGTQVNEWLNEHPEATTTVQDGSLEITKFTEDAKLHILKDYVTPQMFGAIGDGVTDDTEAIIAAITSSDIVVFPSGEYKVTRTLLLSDSTYIVGSGIVLIKYEGEGFLFDINTDYRKPVIIDKIKFEGLSTNSFLKCSRGYWGAGVHLNDCWVQKFDDEVLHLESVFRVNVDKVTFQTKGKAVITSYDGTVGNSNFSNCIEFSNCSFLRYNEDNVPKMFELLNVIQITFNRCTFDHIDLIFDCKDRINLLTLNECWLEEIGAIYSLSGSSKKPILNKCNCVFVSKANIKDTDFTYSVNENTISILGTKTNTLNALHSAENIEIVNHYAYNPNDAYTEYTPVYSIGTKRTFFNSSFNTVTIDKSNVTSIQNNLKNITRYSNTNCVFDISFVIYFDDSSLIFCTCKIFYYKSTYIVGDLQILKQSNWGNALAEGNNVLLSVTNDIININSPINMKNCLLAIKYNYLC